MTNAERRDPFEDLAQPITPQAPRPSFARELRSRVVVALGLDEAVPIVTLPERKPMTATTTSTSTVSPTAPVASVVTPYLTIAGAAEALDWYTEALGAVEAFRVVGDDGRIGHSELSIGGARVMISDDYPEIGVHSPASLNGTTVALHLEVGDVDDLFARAVAAGATSLQEPADQPHGARHGTIVDPFGHRWMLSQTLEQLSAEQYAQRAAGSAYRVEPAGRPRGAIWSAVFYRDAPAGIRFLVDVLGFEERLVVPGPDGTSVVHSEIRWPEGGILQAGTYDAGNPHHHPPGQGGVYVVTADPWAVWERCRAAGAEVVSEPQSFDYDPDGMAFSVRDPEGNVFSFGTYAGEGA